MCGKLVLFASNPFVILVYITFCYVVSSGSHHFLDDLRTTFIMSANGLEALIRTLEDPDLSVRRIAEDCVYALQVHGKT